MACRVRFAFCPLAAAVLQSDHLVWVPSGRIHFCYWMVFSEKVPVSIVPPSWVVLSPKPHVKTLIKLYYVVHVRRDDVMKPHNLPQSWITAFWIVFPTIQAPIQNIDQFFDECSENDPPSCQQSGIYLAMFVEGFCFWNNPKSDFKTQNHQNTKFDER